MDTGRNYVDEVIQVLKLATRCDVQSDVVEKYITTWYNHKFPWISRFHNNTIYTYPKLVEGSMSDTDKQIQIDKFLKGLKGAGYNYTYSRDTFITFIKSQGIAAADNIVSEEFICPDGVKIPKGMKLLRAFKFFFSDKNDLTSAQDDMNLIISRSKFSGYLHLSVDPLDYLSLSENNYGWRSCHALDGDYAAGNLEYMMDNATIICYIDDNNTTQLNNFPLGLQWNNKKWRMLLFFSPTGEVVIASRQYPFTMNGTIVWDILYECISNLFGSINYSPWSNELISRTLINEDNGSEYEIERHLFFKKFGLIYPLHEIYRDADELHATFYDDIFYSSYYTEPYYLVGRTRWNWKRYYRMTPIVVGTGAVTCPICGEHDIIRGEGWYCDNVDDSDTYTCECCGRRRLHENEGQWINTGEWWCTDCVAENAVTCHICGELCNIEDAVFDEVTGKYTCCKCYDNEED